MTFPIPDAALEQHSAYLGKTGSGKTTTCKLVVEHLVAKGARVCVLDPIKSDWWGLTSSADGKQPGLPFHILGGPRGHVPLHAGAGAAIGEIVARGDLPLSILDMAQFEPGGLLRFFNDFAPALMRNMTGVLHLVLEEAHEFAPKERAGIGNENMAIHYSKKLATAGRSMGIRLLVLTQSVQQLHNRVLGSCETMVAHRFTTPADQKPVKDWLKANMDKATFDRVSDSMASLKTGAGWICSGELQIAKLVSFPRLTTFDNSATPTATRGAVEVKTAAIDTDALRALVGEAVKQAEENDPKTLKAKIKELQDQIANKSTPQEIDSLAKTAHEAGFRTGYQAGELKGRKFGVDVVSPIASQIMGIADQLASILRDLGRSDMTCMPPEPADVVQPVEPRPSKPEMTGSIPAVRSKDTNVTTPQKPAEKVKTPRSGLHPAAEKMTRALGRCAKRFFTWEEAAIIAGILPGNGYFYGGRKDMVANLLVVEVDGKVGIEPSLVNYIGGPEITPREIVELWSGKLRSPAPAMLVHLFMNQKGWTSTEELASAINAKPGNGYWYGGVKALRVAGLIEEGKGTFRVSELLRS